MESRQSERAGTVSARTPRVESELSAARRVIQDSRSDSQIALDKAVERMLADMAAIPDHPDDAAHAQPGAEEETAPAVHIVSRNGVHARGHQ